MFRKRLTTGLIAGLIMLPSMALANLDEIVAEQINETTVSLGYRGVSTQGVPNRAREYDALKPSPTLDLSLRQATKKWFFNLDADYLNSDDFNVEGEADRESKLHFRLQADRFVHNLDHFPFDRPDASFSGTLYNTATGLPDVPTTEQSFTRVDFDDLNPDTDYGLRINQLEAAVRAKLPEYPAHANLKYWRWEKTGRRQLRYLNEGCATNCHVISRDREIDMVTEEVSGSIDAHVGWFDLVVEQVFRVFDNKARTPIDAFEGHFLRAPYPTSVVPGDDLYQHDETPDASYRETTFKANTNLGGGFVANASFSLGKRENESDDLTDVGPVRAETDLKKLASDITYIPSEALTVNLRYRMLDLKNDNVSMISAEGLSFFSFSSFSQQPRTQPLPVRRSISLDRDLYEASATYRPGHKTSIKARFRIEDIDRSDTNGPFAHHADSTGDQIDLDPVWELPERERILRLKLAYATRFFDRNQLKLNTWWEYQKNNDPAYGISLEDAQTLFASATYLPGPFWGVSASLRFKDGKTEGLPHSQFEDAIPIYYLRDRNESVRNVSLGAWLNPSGGLNFDLNYGYLETRIDQDLLFGSEPDTTNPGGRTDYTIFDDDTEYEQTVHTLSLGASWQILEALNCRIEGYHIRSKAHYTADFPARDFLFNSGELWLINGSSDGLREISEVDIRQNGLKGRINWQFHEQWSAGFEATFDDYDDKGGDDFDGSVQTYMASLSRTW